MVLGGCINGVMAAAFPNVCNGIVGASLALGFSILTMAYAVGHISGGHFNRSDKKSLLVGGKFNVKQLSGYIIA